MRNIKKLLVFSSVCLFASCNGQWGGQITVNDKCGPDWPAGQCSFGFVCDANLGKCVPEKANCSLANPGGICTADADGKARVCVNGTCVTESSATKECGKGGSRCKDGYSCQSDACEQITEENKCSPKNPTGLCQDDSVCLNGYCYVKDDIVACDPIKHPAGWCPNGQYCSGSGCADIEANKVCPDKNAPDKCGDCQCPAWQSCVNGQCQYVPPSCNEYGCPAGYGCQSGQCQKLNNLCSTHNLNGVCAEGSVCKNGECIPAADTCSSSNPNGLCTGYKECVDGSCQDTACSSANPNGFCQVGQICNNGTCETSVCSPFVPTGTCEDPNDECRKGYCTLALCSSEHKGGYCPDSETYCYEGTCINYVCSKDHPNGLCGVGTICDSDTNSATFGTCIEGPCSSVNTDGTCPAGYVCQETNGGIWDCVRGTCSNKYPTGQCKARGYQCLCNDATPDNPEGSCKSDPVSCDEAAIANGSCYSCQVPFCGPNAPGGRCPVGQTCQVDYQTGYSCQSPACDAFNPTGWCANGRICTNGRCVATGCNEDPSLCDPLSEYCDKTHNQCETADCGDNAPNGKCGIGLACLCNTGREADCDITLEKAPYCKNGTGCWSCNVPSCSADYPGGQCNDRACQLATTEAKCKSSANCHWVAGCVGLAGCSANKSQTSCKAMAGCTWQQCTDTRICASGECVSPACSAAYPDGACSANSKCVNGTCVVQKCSADYPTGTCSDAGAGYICRNGTCVYPSCSPAYPYGFCPKGQTCKDGSCINLCSLTHDGYCPGGLTCVNGLCLTACEGDYDCDGVPDEVEGDDDLDKDGFPNWRDRDSDGDLQSDDYEYDHVYNGNNGTSTTGKCAKLPCDTDGDGTPDMYSIDSDGDYIPDVIEAGPVPLQPRDSDGDGIPDLYDLDSDGDGINDEVEAGDYNISTAPIDTDGDGIYDYLDLDSDGDGIPDAIEARQVPHDDKEVVDPYNPADHNNDGIPDFQDLDSDGDGVVDSEEDINGDGIVNCQVDALGAMVFEKRTTVNCTGFDYNPGCRSSAKKPCILQESSRIHKDTDRDGLDDSVDGVYKACGSANVKPIASYYSQAADFSIALESDFNKYLPLTISGKEVGATFDAVYTTSGANLVAGFIISKTPDASVITGLPYDETSKDFEKQKLNKAIAQSEKDLIKIKGMSGVDNVSEVFKRFITTFDGYGSVINRYRITRNKALELRVQRNRLVTALLGATPVGLDNDSQIGAPDTTFTLLTQTIYRYDNHSNNGRVIILGALIANDNFRSCGSIDNANACGVLPSCVWENNSCKEYSQCGSLVTKARCGNNSHCRWSDTDGECQRKQLPMFYADNITSGSTVGQYGDTLGLSCQTITQEQGKVDFIWVVDESGSMQQEIDRVKEAGAIFFPLLNNSEADYQVGITTTFLRPDGQDCLYYPPSFNFINDYSAYQSKSFLCGHGVENENDSIDALGTTKHPSCFQNDRPPEGEAGELIGKFTIRKPFVGGAACSNDNQSGYCYNCSANPVVPAVGCRAEKIGNMEPEYFDCPDCAGKTGWIESPYCHFASHLPCDFTYHGHEFGLFMGAWAYEKARLNPAFTGLSTLPQNRQLRTKYGSNGEQIPVVMVFLSDEEDRFMKTSTDAAADVCLNSSKSSVGDNWNELAGIYQQMTCGEHNGKVLPPADINEERSCRQSRLAKYYKESGLTTFAIVGPKGSKCELPFDAEQGDGYISVAEGTEGGYGSICDTNLYPTVEEVIVSSLAIASPYELVSLVNGDKVQPISSTIKVAVEICADYPNCSSGRTVKVTPRSREDGFDYDANRNKLILYGNGRVKLNGEFTSSYRYWINNYQPPSGSDANHCVSGGDMACPDTWSHCAAMDSDKNACNADAKCTYSEGICKTKNCACENGLVCDAVSGSCQADPSCEKHCPPACTSRTTPSICHDLEGCIWMNGKCEVVDGAWTDPCSGLSQSQCNSKTSNGAKICRFVNNSCEMLSWETCDNTAGVCVCDQTCGGACLPGEKCDGDLNSPTCGKCVCDQSCGGGCGAGAYCDTNLSSATCGQCLCDTTCGNSCEASQNQVCDSDPNSSTCGLCRPDPTCCAGKTPGADGDCCDDGFNCDVTLGQCVCDTTCGGSCGAGQRCDANVKSPTCGQCLCDQTCNGGCPQGQCCDDNDSCDDYTALECGSISDCHLATYGKMNQCESLTCGQCKVDPTCCNCMELPAGAENCCAEGATCDPNTGLCSITVQECPPAFAWDPSRGQCVYIGG